MPVLAAIDIGTNSTKMTIANVDEGGSPVVVRVESKTTRLGRDVDKLRHLESRGTDATLEEILRYKRILDENSVDGVSVVGTSALRDADNGTEFLARVKQQTGFDVEILTGEREAELAYLAVFCDPSLGVDPERPLMVFDLGGGSTELILGAGRRLLAHKSVNIGAVRITERCLSEDPPSPAQIEDARSQAVEIIHGAGLPPEMKGAQVVGLGGTLVNLAAIRLGSSGDAHGAGLSAGDIEELLLRLSAVPLSRRRQIAGLDPDRADVIVGGAILVQVILGYIGTMSFRVSVRGLRFGLLSEMAERARQDAHLSQP